MWILTASNFEPWVMLGLVLASLLYAAGIVRLYWEAGSERVLDRGHIASFAAGMFLLSIALGSPLDEAADQLFSAHMLQHILLMMVVPPLLVWSRPTLAFVWAFTPVWRKRIGRAWSAGRLDSASKVLMHPLVVFVLFCGAFVFWHLPRPYVWGFQNEFVHALEHLSFLLTALAFWTIIIEPSGRRRLDYATTLLYLVVTVVVSDMPGALMVLAPQPLYPIHAEGAAAWGLSLMQDQQLAGLIMWIPAGAIYIAAAIWLFVRLMDSAERRALKLHRSVPVAIVVLFFALFLTGCRGEGESKGGGDPVRGAALIAKLGCGTCHNVPGIDGATGLVGPPLDRMGARVYIAGVMRNTPDNMIAWLRDPQAIVPGNAMPSMDLDRDQASDIAAFLSGLN